MIPLYTQWDHCIDQEVCCIHAIMCTNNEKNDQFYRKVAFLMYPERVNFRPQRWKEASKLKPHRGLGTRLSST